MECGRAVSSPLSNLRFFSGGGGEKKNYSPVDRHDQPGRLAPIHGRQRRQQPSPLRRSWLDALLRVELDVLRRSLGGRVPDEILGLDFRVFFVVIIVVEVECFCVVARP